MTCKRVAMPDGGQAIIMVWDSPTYEITAARKRYRFEMHPRFGPYVVDRSSCICEPQPGPRSPFWKAVSLWAQQGQRIGDDGRCLWNEEPKPILKHLGGRHYEVIGWEEGKQGG